LSQALVHASSLPRLDEHSKPFLAIQIGYTPYPPAPAPISSAPRVEDAARRVNRDQAPQLWPAKLGQASDLVLR